MELLALMDLLEQSRSDHSVLHLIQQKFDSLSANSIYQTFMLHSICKTARSEDYMQIEYPEMPSSTVIQEVDVDEEPEEFATRF